MWKSQTQNSKYSALEDLIIYYSFSHLLKYQISSRINYAKDVFLRNRTFESVRSRFKNYIQHIREE